MHKLRNILLAISSFFLIFSSKVSAVVGTAPNGYNFDNHRQYILANQLREDTNAGLGLTSNITTCNSNNGLVSFDFKADFLDSTKSYIVEIPYSMNVVSNAPITGTPSTFFLRPNTRNPSSPSAFDTQTIGVFNTDAVNSELSNGYYNLYYNLSVYLLVTPNNSGSTSKRLQLGDYTSTVTSNTLFNMVNFSNCSGTPNATATLRQQGFNYIEVDDSQVVSQPLLLMYLIESVKNISQGSAADLTTIEAAVQAISNNSSLITTQLNTIAGNQVTMNDNMVDYIENARDVISSTISTQTSNLNAQSAANASAINQQIANSASSINSQISTTGQAISSGISTTNSNLSGISSQLNTIASNQVTANDNLIDYLDLIIANQQQSSGTIDYQYQQQTAQNTSSINQILTTDDMTTTEQAGLETVYSDLFDNLSFDSVMEMDGYADNPSQQKITDLAKNLYQSAIGIFGVNLDSEALDFNSQTNLLYFIANSYNGPTWAKYFDFFNLSAYRIDGSRVNNSFSVKDTSSLVCKPLFVPLPKFVLNWLDYSSIPRTRPSVSTTNLALYSNVSSYSVAPFGCSYEVEYKCYGFLIPCLYDIFPDFFFNGWGRAWMWVNAMSIILWLVYDLIHFVLDSLSLTIKPANDTVQFLNKGNK